MKSDAPDPLLDVIDIVHEAALDPQLWPAVAAMMSATFADAHIGLGVFDARLGVSSIDIEILAPVDQKLFREHYDACKQSGVTVYRGSVNYCRPRTVDVRPGSSKPVPNRGARAKNA